MSYSTRDIAVATSLRENITQAGGEVFLAEYSISPGESLPPKIIAAIEGCDLFLLLWSTNAKSSEWVPQEIGIAKANKKYIMPLILHPGIQLTGFITELKYLEFYKNPQAAVTWLRSFVAGKKSKKDNREVVTAFAVGAAILFALSKSE